MHGAGNDFIVTKNLPAEWSREEIGAICARRTAVGADGLIEVRKKQEGHIAMRYFNADGGEASFCGNGARCAIYFAALEGWIGKEGRLFFQDGQRDFEYEGSDKIAVEFPIQGELHTWQEGHFIDTGSPHVCIQLPAGQLDSFPVDKKARPIRHDADFEAGGGTNVNFYEKKGNRIRMRTFERGVEAETLACGTGTVAVGLVARTLFPELGDRIEIEAPGGLLEVEKRDNYWLTGPSRVVYEAELQS